MRCMNWLRLCSSKSKFVPNPGFVVAPPRHRQMSDASDPTRDGDGDGDGGRPFQEGGRDSDSASAAAWEALVDFSKLSPLEVQIHERHLLAMKENRKFYKDPATGYDVMTRQTHLERGKCCGNACRHCPYGHASVEESKRMKIFNGAFYV